MSGEGGYYLDEGLNGVGEGACHGGEDGGERGRCLVALKRFVSLMMLTCIKLSASYQSIRECQEGFLS